MRIAAVCKWARDARDARVDAEGSVDWRNAPPVAGRDDDAVLGVAGKLAGPGGEVVGVTLGRVRADWAAARGAGRVVAVDPPEVDAADPVQVAEALAALVRRVGDVDVVLIGDVAVDVGVPVVPALLGASLGFPVLLGADDVTAQDRRLRVRWERNGVQETLELPVPAVIAVTAAAAPIARPGMRQLLQARRQPVETVPVGELQVSAPQAEVRSSAPARPVPRRRLRIDGSNPEAAAAEAVAALQVGE